MTIDEAIEQFYDLRVHYIQECCEDFNESDAEAVRMAIEALEELKWWRGQDLIPRERALKCLYSCEHELFCTETDWLKKCLEEIPKAEPPTSSKMEQVQITDKAPIIDKCPIEWDSEEDSVYDRGDKQ